MPMPPAGSMSATAIAMRTPSADAIAAHEAGSRRPEMPITTTAAREHRGTAHVRVGHAALSMPPRPVLTSSENSVTVSE